MVEIPGGSVTLRIEVRERECGFYESSPAGGHRFANVYNFCVRAFERAVTLQRFAMDLTPVTNAQFAAQGPDGRRYPWGNDLLPGRCNGGETGGTTPVNRFPDGRSPFDIHDLCGNVWEWTESERTDGRTRFCLIRGGSYYVAKGSGWYMDGGPRPASFSEKFLMMWPGLDRCATIGFRCVVDLEP